MTSRISSLNETAAISSSRDTGDRAEYTRGSGYGRVPEGRPGASFFTRQRELARRRLWPIALTLLIWLLYHVVGVATSLTFTAANAARNQWSAAERAREMRDILSGLLGVHNTSWLFFTIPLAVVLAVEGFAWMDSRREVDFYESLPVPRRQRFADICVGSFLYFVFAYLITLEIGLVIAGGMGALSRPLLIEIAQQAVNNIAFFLSVYALGVLSTMLTGNVVIALLAFGVLFFYEAAFKILMQGFCEVFLTTWSGRPPRLLTTFATFPVYHLLNRDGAFRTPAELLVLAAYFLLLAWICCRLRRNEFAGTAVIFRPVRTVVRIAVSVMAGLVGGLIFSASGEVSAAIIALVWLVLLTVITACVMQIIYEYDFRALFRHPLEICAAVIIAAAVYLGFLFDVAGYDRFVPDPGQVTDAALYSTEYNESICNDEGYVITTPDFSDLYMHLENVEDVIRIADYGQEYTRKVRTQHGEDSAVTIDEDTAAAAGSAARIPERGREYNLQVRYTMKDGSTVYRNFILPDSIDPAMMDAVTGTQQYREGRFYVYHDNVILANADRFNIMVTNGKDWASRGLKADLYQELHDACIRDLAQFSYSFARNSRPVARIEISYHDVRSALKDPSPALEGLTVTLPVYPSFTNTIEVLKKMDVWPEPLDYDSLPAYENYEDLTSQDQELLDAIDFSVFSGPFNTGR